MSKILTVVGATGAQGGSVVTSALKSGAKDRITFYPSLSLL